MERRPKLIAVWLAGGGLHVGHDDQYRLGVADGDAVRLEAIDFGAEDGEIRAGRLAPVEREVDDGGELEADVGECWSGGALDDGVDELVELIIIDAFDVGAMIKKFIVDNAEGEDPEQIVQVG